MKEDYKNTTELSNGNYIKCIKNKREQHFCYSLCDLGRIQTYNLLSRNQVHYSVMLRGHFNISANINLFK